MSCWEWDCKVSVRRNVSTKEAHRTGSGWGTRYKYERAPTVQVTATAEGMPWANASALLTLVRAPLSGGSASTAITDRQGHTYTGPIDDISISDIEGTELYSVTITMSDPTIT